MKFTPFKYKGNTLTPEKLFYGNGAIAIIYNYDNGEKCFTLSVNIPAVAEVAGDDVFNKMASANSFFVKNWSENEPLAKLAFATGDFIDTGKTVQTGFVKSPIWVIKEAKT